MIVGHGPHLSPDEQYAGQNWPVLKGMEHQMFNFIRQTDRTLYLAGARGGIDLKLGARIGDDILDLYRVDFIGDQIKLKLVSNKPMDSHPNAQDTLLTGGESNFAAATGFYISPSLELIFYATAHENSGPAGITTAASGGMPVRVINVAPTITEFGVFNSLNQQLGTTVPFFVEGVPATVRASFTDPGKPDRQTALINWGDGESTASGAFDSFSDAFGGVIGELSHTRPYPDAGTFNLTLGVTDDDLDTTEQSMLVPVLTSEQALIRIIEMLDQIIAGTTDPALRKVLLDARKALQWNGDSGALDKLRINDPQAAIVKLDQTLDSLGSAQAAGATVGTLIALVEQVMTSLL